MTIKKEENVLQLVIHGLEEGHLFLSFDAIEQMQKREIKFSDICEAIYRSEREEHKDTYLEHPKTKRWSWRFAIRGKNDVGDKDLRIIFVIQNPKVIIVTAIDLNRRD
jgi:hypothetical protein